MLVVWMSSSSSLIGSTASSLMINGGWLITDLIGPPKLFVKSSYRWLLGKILFIVLKSLECFRKLGWLEWMEYHYEALEFLELLFLVDCSSFSDLSKMMIELSRLPAMICFRSLEKEALFNFISWGWDLSNYSGSQMISYVEWYDAQNGSSLFTFMRVGTLIGGSPTELSESDPS